MKKVVSVTSGLAVLAVLAVAALAVGTSVVAGAVAGNMSGPGALGSDSRCDVRDAIQDALWHREPGVTVGSVISEIAQGCRPQIRH